MSGKNHSIYISYDHHNEDDSRYVQLFRQFVKDIERVESANVDFFEEIHYMDAKKDILKKVRTHFLKDSTVTVLLIGKHTWNNRGVDIELCASLADAGIFSGSNSQRSGVLAILLPTHPNYNEDDYNPYILPPRVYNNLKCDYIQLKKWTNDEEQLQNWIHDAFLDRFDRSPNNDLPLLTANLTGNSWKP